MFGLAVTAVAAIACGTSASGACGDYYDSFNGLAQKCGYNAVFNVTQHDAFVTDCVALTQAPGAGNLPSELSTCASNIKSSACDLYGLVCSTRGTLPNGQACASSAQCSGGVCDTSGTTSTTTEIRCGVCDSFVDVGGACVAKPCDGTVASCVNGKCVAFAKVGETCGGTAGTCQSGLTCDAAMKCVLAPTKGQACTTTCDAPLRCISGTCADAVQAGGPCTANECASSLACDTTSKTCVKPTLAQAGQACGLVNSTFVTCDTNLKCDAKLNTCVALKAQAEACTVGNFECETYLTCIAGACQVPDYTVCK